MGIRSRVSQRSPERNNDFPYGSLCFVVRIRLVSFSPGTYIKPCHALAELVSVHCRMFLS